MKLYNEKRSDLEEQQHHLNIGLRKIRETVEQVEELQCSLSVKRNELEDKNNLANAKLKQMVGVHSSLCYVNSSVTLTTYLGRVSPKLSQLSRQLTKHQLDYKLNSSFRFTNVKSTLSQLMDD